MSTQKASVRVTLAKRSRGVMLNCSTSSQSGGAVFFLYPGRLKALWQLLNSPEGGDIKLENSSPLFTGHHPHRHPHLRCKKLLHIRPAAAPSWSSAPAGILLQDQTGGSQAVCLLLTDDW